MVSTFSESEMVLLTAGRPESGRVEKHCRQRAASSRCKVKAVVGQKCTFRTWKPAALLPGAMSQTCNTGGFTQLKIANDEPDVPSAISENKGLDLPVVGNLTFIKIDRRRLLKAWNGPYEGERE
ncbi:hypothetical protein [Sinorhizobium sp. RAC02]|uniref:hypothetical protein n=1 Tax=Sinorhizobium sp. RAC02 TaxID=1842534 RepID=UPI0012376372|nr:hypothetical protein [Sinorhizobium sp. RAC02]